MISWEQVSDQSLGQFLSDMKIFISIASYVDVLLERTITQAIAKADHPENLVFGVVDQSAIHENSRRIDSSLGANIRYVNVRPEDSRGCCWARNMAMSLYENEDWFMQIDSHMDFEQGWDTYLLNYAHMLQLSEVPAVISFYPPAFEWDGANSKLHRYSDGTLYNGLVMGSVFAEGPDASPKLQFIAHYQAGNEIMQGFHVGGGLIFAPGSFADKFPADPRLYFIGEEQTLSVRLFTHGWNVYSTPASPIYHLYNTGNSYRPMHWDVAQNAKRKIHWADLEHTSTERFKDLVFRGKDLGVYGLGGKRTLDDFAQLCGIDYPNKAIRSEYQLKRT